MDTKTILSHVDHTLLKPEATWEQIKTLCDEAMEFGCATVCIPPAYVKQAADYVQGNLKICTVIGFPNGYNTMAAKIFETKDAVENGASEIDMVINIGWVKDRKWKELAEEIAGVKAACLGRPLKVIIETCLLSDMEKIKLCQVVAKAEAAYLKTSTGFSTGGATREDVALLRENLPESVKVKASGGIRTLEDFRQLLRAGADKISVNSAAVKDPGLISRAAERFGSQCVVLAIDGKSRGDGTWEVVIAGGRTPTGLDVVEWAQKGQELGVGEILLTSMDADGTKAGFDLPMTKAVVDAVSIPVIASGGAGKLEDFAEVFEKTGCDAALAASLFHYGELTVPQVKEYLRSRGITVR